MVTPNPYRKERENLESDYCSGIQIENVFLVRDQDRRRSRGFAPPLWRPGCGGVV
jgi:hypothetical protein